MASITPTNSVKLMFKGNPSDDSVCLALSDAAVFVERVYGVSNSDVNCDMAVRYYACHLLFMQGHAKGVQSKSVGDVSVSYEKMSPSEKESASPYLTEFGKLFIVSEDSQTSI